MVAGCAAGVARPSHTPPGEGDYAAEVFQACGARGCGAARASARSVLFLDQEIL